MACRTCRGRGVVYRIEPPPWSRLPMEKSRRVEQSCPDCGAHQVPFAKGFPSSGTLRFGGGGGLDSYDLFVDPASGWDAERAAEALNQCVARREAALRAALDKVSYLLAPISGSMPWPEGYGRAQHAFAAVREALSGEAEAVTGDEACGLALECGRWIATVEDLALITETVQEARLDVIRPFLRAKGLAEAEPYDAIIRRLRQALRAGINDIAQNGGSSRQAFKEMTAAFDGSTPVDVATEVKRDPLSRASNEALLAECRRRGLG